MPTYFTSYEKIPESPQQWGLEPAGFRMLEKARWVVTEKIHGANFCFVADGSNIRCANRRQFLEQDEPFFGYQELLGRLRERVLLVAALVRRQVNASTVAIYGELFGGAYPHPDVQPNQSVQPVQTGIYYVPGIEFCAFDIAVEIGPERTYLDYERVLEFCHQADLFVAEPLLIGTYAAAMAYPVGFSSTIPRRLGLPPLSEPNLAEGIIIKPVKALEVSGSHGLIRPVLKKKIPAFAEDKRYSAAQRWPARPVEYSSLLETLQWAAFSMVTENRLQSAISKIGPGRARDGRHMQRLFRLVVDDIVDQLKEEYSEALQSLSSSNRKLLTQGIQREVRELLRKRWQNEHNQG